MRYGNEPGPRSQELFEFFQLQLSAVVDGGHAKLCALVFTQNLPGNDIRVMFHGGDQNFIARPNLLAAVGLCYQVDGLRGAAGEDDFLVVPGIQEALDGSAGLFIMLRGAFGKRVHAAMDVGVIVAIIMFDGLDHGQRLLRGGRVIQVDQRLAVNALVKNRKVATDLLDIKSVPHGFTSSARNFSDGAHPTSSKVLSVTAARSPSNLAVSGSHCATRRST